MLNYEIVNLDEKLLMGFCARTGNALPDMPKVIGGLWNTLYQEENAAKITNKKSPYSIGLYSDYGDDLYDITVGFEVSDKTDTSFTYKTIPAGKYAKFSIQGDVVSAVSKAWGEIWNMDLPRTFTGDFEEYCEGTPQDCHINIYVAIR